MCSQTTLPIGLYVSYTNTIFLPMIHQLFTILAYDKHVLNMLPSPYKTNCHRCDGGGYQTEHHCKSDCTEKRMIDTFGMSLFTVTYETSKPFSVIAKYSLFKNRSLEIDINRILHECDQLCARKSVTKSFTLLSLPLN